MTAANLTSVYGGTDGVQQFYNSEPGIEWQFAITVPFSNLPALLAALDAAQKKAADNGAGTNMVNGVSYNVADARAEAAKIADAAGVALTGLVPVSDTYGAILPANSASIASPTS